MERFCYECKWFRDANLDRTYITPQCTQRGTDSAAYMRQHIYGLDGSLYEPKPIEHNGRKTP